MRTWFISDTHFDHKNIIRFCHRPFKSVDEMNAIMLRNWNLAIAPEDLVYFLGDMSYGRGSRKPIWWLERLTGRIIFIRGSHDHGIYSYSILPNVLRVAKYEVIELNRIPVMLVHNPATITNWHGWIIHGHVHDKWPFIDRVRKHINVSVDVTGYRPVKASVLAKEIRGAILK